MFPNSCRCLLNHSYRLKVEYLGMGMWGKKVGRQKQRPLWEISAVRCPVQSLETAMSCLEACVLPWFCKICSWLPLTSFPSPVPLVLVHIFSVILASSWLRSLMLVPFAWNDSSLSPLGTLFRSFLLISSS